MPTLKRLQRVLVVLLLNKCRYIQVVIVVLAGNGDQFQFLLYSHCEIVPDIDLQKFQVIIVSVINKSHIQMFIFVYLYVCAGLFEIG